MKRLHASFFPLTIVVSLGVFIGALGCTTIDPVQSSSFLSPVQEIFYGKGPGSHQALSFKDTQPFGDTRWRIVDVRPSSEQFFRGTELTFHGNGVLVESAELPSGTIFTDTHRYRVVGSTLVLKKDGNTGIALFSIEGTTLNLQMDTHTMVLEQVKR